MIITVCPEVPTNHFVTLLGSLRHLKALRLTQARRELIFVKKSIMRIPIVGSVSGLANIFYRNQMSLSSSISSYKLILHLEEDPISMMVIVVGDKII